MLFPLISFLESRPHITFAFSFNRLLLASCKVLRSFSSPLGRPFIFCDFLDLTTLFASIILRSYHHDDTTIIVIAPLPK